MAIGFVVGMRAEAKLVEHLGEVAIGAAAAAELAPRVSGLVSFGLAGGLHPRLLPGYALVPQRVMAGKQIYSCDAALAARFGGFNCDLILASPSIMASRARKTTWFTTTEAMAVDMESGVAGELAARHGIPFAVLRAICDPADRSLPPVVLGALDEAGKVRTKFILRALAEQPWLIVDLIKLARDSTKAYANLRRILRASGKAGDAS